MSHLCIFQNTFSSSIIILYNIMLLFHKKTDQAWPSSYQLTDDMELDPIKLNLCQVGVNSRWSANMPLLWDNVNVLQMVEEATALAL
jgi:hypothetical protein